MYQLHSHQFVEKAKTPRRAYRVQRGARGSRVWVREKEKWRHRKGDEGDAKARIQTAHGKAKKSRVTQRDDLSYAPTRPPPPAMEILTRHF